MNRIAKHLTTLLLLLPSFTFAHGYWMEIEGSHKENEPATIKIFFGEYISGERLSGNFLDRMKEIRVYVKFPGGEQKAVLMTQQEDYWKGSFTPITAGTYEVIGINDEREVQDWKKHDLGIVRPIQYLKLIYQVGSLLTSQTSSSFLDITVNNSSEKTYAITAFKNKTAYPSIKITVIHPDGEETILDTDVQGRALFTAPKPGLYVVDAEWTDKTPGTFKGKSYETVRHKLDFSLYNL